MVSANMHNPTPREPRSVSNGTGARDARVPGMAQDHDAQPSINDDEEIHELKRRIATLERSLAQSVGELSKIQSSRWWRLASRYWRLRAGVELIFSRLIHPVASLKILAQRYLPVSVRTRVLTALRKHEPAHGGGAGLAREAADHHARSSSGRRFRPRPALLFLPAVPWDYRRQRPQHLAGALAASGWPVFWLIGRAATGGDVEIESGREFSPGLWELSANASTALNPIGGRLEEKDVAKLVRSLKRWQMRTRVHEVAVICEAPYWARLATVLKEQCDWLLVYDLIDLHTGFRTALPEAAEAEEEILRRADLVATTSAVLEQRARKFVPRVCRVPNACELERWSRPESEPLPEDIPGPIIGYFGAISEWFDNGLVEFLAAQRPHWSFVLIGSTWGGAVGRLERLPNVSLLGEQPYERVPGLASHFDVGIIPFRDTPLTRATDPVKVYEMLALGLRVVAAPLPELTKFGDLIEVAESKEEFLQKLDNAVRLPDDEEAKQKRRSFASKNRWEDRARNLGDEIRVTYPKVSIVIVTYNNIPLTKMCLDSVRSQTEYPHYEVIVVDNGSTDGTTSYLEDLRSRWSQFRVVLNGENLGFAAATNQGVRVATGHMLVFLNNDTVVTRGWLCAMVRALRQHQRWGLVGAVTNAIGNEAKISVGYSEVTGLDAWAEEYVWKHRGKSFPLGMAALFCAGLRREVWEEVGELDERFEVGMFEDDDYSRRIRAAGYEIRCLEDCFVHHWQQASFRLLDKEEYERIYEANRRRFLQKWSGAGVTQSFDPGGDR